MTSIEEYEARSCADKLTPSLATKPIKFPAMDPLPNQVCLKESHIQQIVSTMNHDSQMKALVIQGAHCLEALKRLDFDESPPEDDGGSDSEAQASSKVLRESLETNLGSPF
jgi:hypothetical protein